MTGFVSQEFEEFLRKNGISHVMSAPYHPASNGLAERAVQIVKKGLKKETTDSMDTRLAKVFFFYRITPQSTTGLSPSELLLGRRPRIWLDLLRPNTAERVERKQEAQKNRHDWKSRVQTFRIGDSVFVRNFMAGRWWLPGQITDVLGRVNYKVQLECGRWRKCHQDHLRERVVDDRSDGIVPQVSQGISDESLEFDATSAGDTGRQKPATEALPPSPDTSAMEFYHLSHRTILDQTIPIQHQPRSKRQ